MELFPERITEEKRMKKVSVIIPNYNGMQYLQGCLDSLHNQSFADYEIIFVDNGSADESVDFVEDNYPDVKVIALEENTGFCRAVNEGIRNSRAEYVILLNNDTEVTRDFLKHLYEGMEGKKNAFSGSAMMVQYHQRELLDDAGNYYNAFGWAFAYGKGKKKENYRKERKIFSSCAGAAIYRRAVFEEIGYFDEEHFAYLEDTDVGYRAQIAGYENWYFPKAEVYHIGSGTSGSRYNLFKVRYSSRNNVYLIYKNMPLVQILLNSPFLISGFLIKWLFFVKKGFGKEYAAGIKNGLALCKKEKKVDFQWENVKNYGKIQVQLWINVIRRFL